MVRNTFIKSENVTIVSVQNGHGLLCGPIFIYGCLSLCISFFKFSECNLHHSTSVYETIDNCTTLKTA